MASCVGKRRIRVRVETSKGRMRPKGAALRGRRQTIVRTPLPGATHPATEKRSTTPPKKPRHHRPTRSPPSRISPIPSPIVHPPTRSRPSNQPPPTIQPFTIDHRPTPSQPRLIPPTPRVTVRQSHTLQPSNQPPIAAPVIPIPPPFRTALFQNTNQLYITYLIGRRRGVKFKICSGIWGWSGVGGGRGGQ